MTFCHIIAITFLFIDFYDILSTYSAIFIPYNKINLQIMEIVQRRNGYG